jgi:hypothetical protein
MRFGLLFLAALPLLAAVDADMTGKWTLEGEVAGHTISMSCAVKQNPETKITGKCTVNGGEEVEIAGENKEAKVSFVFDVQGYTLTYTGQLEGNAVKGEIEVAGATGTFSGKRDAS